MSMLIHFTGSWTGVDGAELSVFSECMVEMGDTTMRSNKNIGLNYLKLLLTLFVVLHHTILAYLPGGPGVTVDDPDNVTGFMYIVVYFDQSLCILLLSVSCLL